MTYLTGLIGRLGKKLGIGAVSTTAPPAPPLSETVTDPARPFTEADAAAAAAIAGD